MQSGGKFFPVCTEEFATAVFVQELGSSKSEQFKFLNSIGGEKPLKMRLS
jgi:hypothetical protein